MSDTSKPKQQVLEAWRPRTWKDRWSQAVEEIRSLRKQLEQVKLQGAQVKSRCRCGAVEVVESQYETEDGDLY